MLSLTRRQSREVDAIAIERYGFSGLVLMENAGRGVVDLLLGIDPALLESRERRVFILCGKGNNAGDGFVIARHLDIRGVAVQVGLLAAPEELRGDALANYAILARTEVPIIDLSQSADRETALTASAVGASWIVDAMLGTGARGEPREPYATAIRWLNSQAARRLAIDLPSGLDCDTGQPAASTVRADHTCTFVAAKAGFFEPIASEFLGQLHVVSIGIPSRLVEEMLSEG